MKKIFFLILISFSFLFSSENEDESNLVKVEFQGQYTFYQDGTNYLIFNFKIKDHWHIYWRNPGDSGIPTSIEIDSILGFDIGEIMWPAPSKFPFDDLANYGYSDSVKLIVPVNVAKNIKPGTYTLKANLSWLVCKEKCIGQDTSFTFQINYSEKSYRNMKFINPFEISNYKFPRANVRVFADKKNDTVNVILPKWQSNDLQFFPYDSGIFVHGETQKILENFDSSERKLLVIKFDPFKIETPKKLKGLLIDQKDKSKVFEIDIPIIYNSQNSDED